MKLEMQRNDTKMLQLARELESERMNVEDYLQHILRQEFRAD